MRITGGVFRSRMLRAPKGDGTRPTSDRVREALFSMLAAESPILGARVLDLYAGTGALAFEAISRGAVHATLVEKNRNALTAISENITALGLEDVVRIHATPVERVGALLDGEPFDLIFADPPYADIPNGVVVRALEPIFLSAPLAAHARIVIEHASRDQPPVFSTSLRPAKPAKLESPAHENPDPVGAISLELLRQRTWGDTSIAIFGIVRAD